LLPVGPVSIDPALVLEPPTELPRARPRMIVLPDTDAAEMAGISRP
jgi:hypothetical protein